MTPPFDETLDDLIEAAKVRADEVGDRGAAFALLTVKLAHAGGWTQALMRYLVPFASYMTEVGGEVIDGAKQPH